MAESYDEWKKRKMLLGRIKYKKTDVYTVYARNLRPNPTPEHIADVKKSIKQEHARNFPGYTGRFQFKLVPVTATKW
ncbi:MAG: hypothetical protein M0R51_05260 [Clostridia bacterium]|jgi:hypothetical protein|nr:hypothetical protein [Clostridia bacterium]